MEEPVHTEDRAVPADTEKLWRGFSLAAGMVVLALGCAVLAGWLFHVPLLKSVLPDLVSMKANTALAFLLAGADMVLLSVRGGGAGYASVNCLDCWWP